MGDYQTSMQYALDIASEFFSINDISINNEKTVAIPINQGVKIASLSISDQPISIVKKGKAHRYLGIFLLTKGLSKPSLAKAHLDVHFFVNVVLRKAIMDKKYFYLVSTVLQPIVSYRMQFNFVSSSVCHKWNILVKKGLRSKTYLPRDFLNKALHHPSFYGLKLFDQIQSESKVAAVISFSNALGILGQLFLHHFLDLQVLGWTPLNPLQFSVKLLISFVNNFLAGVVRIFLDCKLSLAGFLPSTFRDPGNFPMSEILGKSLFFSCVHSLKCFRVAFDNRLLDKKGAVMDWKTFYCWKRLDPRGSVPHWFNVTSRFLLDRSSMSPAAVKADGFSGCSILDSEQFAFVHDGLLKVWSGSFDIYTDSSLKFAGFSSVISETAAYFFALDSGVGVGICGLLSSTLLELQAMALALECVPPFCTVVLHLDSQAVIDACVSKLAFAVPDFCNHYLAVSWVKVKSHSGVPGNNRANTLAGETTGSPLSLPAGVYECFLEAGSGHDVIPVALLQSFDWIASTQIWHLDLYMLAGFTSHKSLYDKSYPGMQYLLCNEVELPDHVFTCSQDVYIWGDILSEASACWISLAGACDPSSSSVLRTLNLYYSNVSLYSVMYREFVLKDWCAETVGIFGDVKSATSVVVNFVRYLVKLHRSKMWLTRSKFRVDIEKAGLVGDNGLVVGLLCCGSSVLSDRMVRLLGIVESFAVNFGHCRPCPFFSGLNGNLRVVLGV
ncbi:hypothetical protein G9A89_020446 [Geosiphon pyriformis]|nr:hypothetical protein G9A89_020446 [Geosiphon pyriformis]